MKNNNIEETFEKEEENTPFDKLLEEILSELATKLPNTNDDD